MENRIETLERKVAYLEKLLLITINANIDDIQLHLNEWQEQTQEEIYREINAIHRLEKNYNDLPATKQKIIKQRLIRRIKRLSYLRALEQKQQSTIEYFNRLSNNFSKKMRKINRKEYHKSIKETFSRFYRLHKSIKK